MSSGLERGALPATTSVPISNRQVVLEISRSPGRGEELQLELYLCHRPAVPFRAVHTVIRSVPSEAPVDFSAEGHNVVASGFII